MTPGEKGQMAVKVIILWTILSVLFALFVWPHLLRMIEEQRRREIVKRQQAAYDKACRIIVDEEIEREASRILAKLDDDAKAFALDNEFEYRRAADGRRSA